MSDQGGANGKDGRQTAFITRTGEEMERLSGMWERQRQRAEEAAQKMDRRILNPCAGCVMEKNCKKHEVMQAWREEQKFYARKDPDAIFSRTCGDRYSVETPVFYDLKEMNHDGSETAASGEAAGVGVSDNLQVQGNGDR